MIPQQLTLRNFLSYREATLDFRGLHVACICGPNGAGKSSLLDAIAWVVWGQSRTASEDEMIYLGEQEAQVDFLFASHGQMYRIIRTRHRGQASSLEFQVNTSTGFRSITERGLRATQQAIQTHLRLDYDTFVNSGYLRQGRADEFMLKRPSDRKQLLSELLKLDEYDRLAERAKDLSRQFKGQATLLEQNLGSTQTQLQQGEAIAAKQASLEAEIETVQTLQQTNQTRLQTLQAQQQQRQTQQQQLTWQQRRQDNLNQDVQHLQHQLTSLQQQQQELEGLLQQESTVLAEYEKLQYLQTEAEAQNQKFQAHQVAQEQQQALRQQQTEQINQLKGRREQVKAQLEVLLQQEQEIQQTLSKTTEVDASLKQLREARARLNQLDQLQTQAFPLLQRQQQLQIQLERQISRLSARLEELHSSTRQLQTQQSRQPQIQQAVLQITEQIDQFENKRIYQQRVQEKGLERRSFMERLQTHQREHETQLAHLDHKMQLLGQPDALCPLCDRPLDQRHWALVQQKHEQQKQDIYDQIWLIREQLAVSEREIQVLRQEYRHLGQELSYYNAVLERRGQLQEQLSATDQLGQVLQQILVEVETIERSLQTGDYAAETQAELQLLEQALSQLNYDEQDHALARGQVERWRWAEIKQAEIKQAQRRQAQVAKRVPELQAQMTALQDQLDHQQGVGQFQVSPSELQQQINQLEHHLAEINYSREQHHHLQTALRHAQDWQLRYQALQQAQQQYPQIQQQSHDLAQRLQQRSQDLEAVITEIQALNYQLAPTTDCSDSIQSLEQQMLQQRRQLDQQLAQLGRLQQQQQQLDVLKRQYQSQQQQLQTARRQTRIYQELTQAFGKNGIQALMIENVLPQLEAETNQLLARLSANQLHVQFVTQRASRGSRSTTKLIDTLDILIADAHGTRPYETYSGGEAFRVNFAIRLALARLLSQHSGSDLQMLIIDEGFGTQDLEGCERLVAAINAIASDFACILTVTHMPFLKEAFQTRIEVAKTPVGSQLSLLA